MVFLEVVAERHHREGHLLVADEIPGKGFHDFIRMGCLLSGAGQMRSYLSSGGEGGNGNNTKTWYPLRSVGLKHFVEICRKLKIDRKRHVGLTLPLLRVTINQTHH